MSWFSDIFGGVTEIVGEVFADVPIVGGIANGLNTIVNGRESERQLEASREYNSYEAQLNRNFQTSERLASQEYNSPANQLKLTMNAGINPNSLFTGSNPFVATDASNGSQASTPAEGYASQYLLKDATIANLLANAKKTNAEAQGKQIDNSFLPKINENIIAKSKAEIDELGSKKGFTDEQTRQMKELFPLLQGKTALELDELQGNIDVLLGQANKLAEEARKLGNEADSAEYKAKNDKLDLELRELLGVSPDNSLVGALIQLIGSGENGGQIVSSMFETIISIGKAALSHPYNPINLIPDIIKKGIDTFSNEKEPVIVNPFAP